MPGMFRLSKVKQFPQPHDISLAWFQSLEDASSRTGTIIPIAFHDEAKLPSAVYTNPEHASFAETDNANCSADSRVNSIQATLRISMTAPARTTDNLQAARIGFTIIHCAFKEDLTAIDELTSVETQDVLELTSEATDRQTYPVYSGTDYTAKYGTSSTMGADQPGLTTDTKLESVVFDPDLYYDALNYYTISGKLRKIQTGLRWITLTHNNTTRLLKFRIKRNTKRMNPYTFLGLLIYVPQVSTKYQLPAASETTAINHFNMDFRARYLEWNDNFNHERA